MEFSEKDPFSKRPLCPNPIIATPQFWEFLFMGSASLSNGQRARSLRTRPQTRVNVEMVGVFTTEATIKIKHTRRGTHLKWKKPYAFGNGSWRPNSGFMGKKGRKNCKTQPEPAFDGSLLVGLGRSLTCTVPPKPKNWARQAWTGSRSVIQTCLR